MAKADLAKRRRVMQRSMKLGHCVCSPRRPCPCEVFTSQGICSCAGERSVPQPAGQVRLTEHVRNAGCASKIAPADLEQVLLRLGKVEDPAVISGLPAGDDAGIYQIAEGVRLVQTVDVFTPCCDDPATFGRICAANCLSDIYAMGGTPRTALSILGFPTETLDGEIMHLMLWGAMEVLASAGVALIGGHSVNSEEILLGFAVTGTVQGAGVSHETATPGDLLVLTKPLGAGVLAFCRQIGRPGGDHAAAEASMAALNKPAAEAMVEVGVSAATDVTGFGLLGHLARMCRHSGVTARVWTDRLPAFGGALEALADDVVPGAVERNRELLGDDLVVGEGVDEAMIHLAFDAQTSGGMLISVQADRHERLLTALSAHGATAWTIGRIVGKSAGRIELKLAAQDDPGQLQREASVGSSLRTDVPRPAVPAATEGNHCCSDAGETHGAGGTAADVAAAFSAMMAAIARPGAIDAKTKELVNFALVVMARCSPCLEAHLAKAKRMGIPQAQLDEAAWCAAAIGGAPVKIFYDDCLRAAEGKAKVSKNCC